LNKTILKLMRHCTIWPHQYVNVGFSQCKIMCSLAYTIGRKQSGFGIQTIIQIGLKS